MCIRGDVGARAGAVVDEGSFPGYGHWWILWGSGDIKLEEVCSMLDPHVL